jgi:hypothetical protein
MRTNKAKELNHLKELSFDLPLIPDSVAEVTLSLLFIQFSLVDPISTISHRISIFVQ